MQPARVEQLVRPVLEPGEEILWMGAPDMWRACRHVLPAAALAVTLTVLLLSLDSGLGVVLISPYLCIALPWLLTNGFPYLFRDAYAVTNRRAIIIRGGTQPTAQSYRFVDPGRIERAQRGGIRNDLLFGMQFMADRELRHTGFLCIPDVGGAEAALRRMAAGRDAGPAAAFRDLRAEDAATREKGFAALARLGPAADAALADALADADPCVRLAAAQAAGKLAKGRLPGVPVLVALAACLDDRLERTRDAAGQSLETIASIGPVTVVRALLGHPCPASKACIERVLALLSATVLARGALEAVAMDDREVGSLLYDNLAARPMVRGLVIRAWAETARTRSEELIPLLKDRPLWARLWIAQALGSAGVTSARQRLAELLGSADRETSLVGAVGLGYMGDPRAVDRLVAALDSSDREVRLSAAVALSHLGAPAGAALEPLRKLLHQEADPYVSEACQTALNRITFALRRQPTELQAAEAPAGRGTEPEAAQLPEGTGTEPTWSPASERRRTP